MFLTKVKGIDLSGERLLGLVDGAQAIVLTLLVIELPALIIEAMQHVEEASTLAFVVATDLIGYLLAALIVFDIWGLQKTTIDSTKPSNVQSLMCIATLWLSTLIPAFFYLTEKFAQDGFIEAHRFTSGAHFGEIILFRSFLLLVIWLVYFLLYSYVAKNAEGGRQNEIRFVRELARLRIVSLAIIFLVSLLVSVVFSVAYALVPILIFVPVLFVMPKSSRFDCS